MYFYELSRLQCVGKQNLCQYVSTDERKEFKLAEYSGDFDVIKVYKSDSAK